MMGSLERRSLRYPHRYGKETKMMGSLERRSLRYARERSLRRLGGKGPSGAGAFEGGEQ
jgi:hypothetical protein